MARRLAGHIRLLDASRPVTSAVNGPWKEGWSWQQTDDFFAALDVGGYNYEWERYVKDHDLHPHRVMIGTESFPKHAFQNWMSVLEHDWVTGDFVWTALDYLGEAGIGRVDFDRDQERAWACFPGTRLIAGTSTCAASNAPNLPIGISCGEMAARSSLRCITRIPQARHPPYPCGAGRM